MSACGIVIMYACQTFVGKGKNNELYHAFIDFFGHSANLKYTFACRIRLNHRFSDTD